MNDIADYAVREIVLEDDRFVLYRGCDARSANVLIKVARARATPRALSAFSSDFLIARRCDIPAIPRPIRIATLQDGSTFQVRQHVPGRPLSLWIDAVMPRPSLGEAIQIGVSIIKALEPLHARGFVHCDLSPRNLLYDFETRAIYFADCAWAQGHASSPPSGRAFDSPYLAPEQRAPREAPVDARTDLFAVGVIVRQLLSGELPPSDGASVFPPDDRIPPVAASVLARLLSHDREHRYLTAAAARKELAEVLDQWRGQTSERDAVSPACEVSGVVRFPEEPFGRQAVRGALYESFIDATRGNPTLVLLTGAAGAGKSTLLADLRATARASDALVLSGGWTPLDRDIPFRGLASVWEQLVDWVSTLEKDERARQISQLRLALGEACGVATERFPVLEVILGIHPRPAAAGTVERQNRLTYCFSTLLAALGSPERPVLLLLEDLHWADAASLLMLERLPGRAGPRHLLTVGTVRTGAAGGSDELVPAIAGAARERGQTVATLFVTPFEQADTQSFLARALGLAASDVALLAEPLTNISLGNPFALREILASAAAKGLLRFSPEDGRWLWRLEEIRQSHLPDDVAEILSTRLSSLPPNSLAALRTAACIATQFEAGEVAALMERSAPDVTAALALCVEAGFLVPLDADRYEFRHERIQSAAYHGLAPAERERRHARRGAALLFRYHEGRRSELLFETVSHLNRCHALREARDDLSLAKLNFEAAVLAKDSTAYDTAAQLLRHVDSQLPADIWVRDPALAFESALLRAECEYLSRRVSAAHEIYAALLARVDDPQKRLAVLMTRMRMLANMGCFEETVADGLACLADLGLALPKNPKKSHVLGPMLRVLALHRRLPKTARDVNITTLDDRTSTIFTCLAELWGPAFWLNENLTGLVIFAMVHLSLTRGNCAASSIGYASYGVFLADALKRERLGKEVCRLGVTVAELAGDATYVGRARFIYEAFFGHFDQPLRSAVATFRELVSVCLRGGDYPKAGAAANMFLYYLPVVGTPLSDFLTEAVEIVGMARQTDQSRTIVTVEILRRWIAILEGRAERDLPRFSIDLSGKGERKNENERGLFHLFEISLLYLLEDYDAAVEHIDCLPGNKMLSGYFAAYYAFFAALVLARRGQAGLARSAWFPAFRQHRRLIARHAARSPQNYRHMQLLLDAIGVAFGRRAADVPRLFQAAIDDARDQGFIQNAAIAEEWLAEHLERHREAKAAEQHLRSARIWYHQWGCLVKVDAIDRRLARTEALTREPPSNPGEQPWPTNAASVLEAARALSGETDAARLAERLIVSIVEHTNATRAALLMREGDDLKLACERRAVSVPVSSGTAGAAGDLPHVVLNYVDRLGRPLRLTASTEHELFGRDPYMARHPQAALVCVPLMHMRQGLGVLFLEKDRVGETFSHPDLVTAEILAAQAAVTLSSAREYNERLAALQNQMHPHLLFNALSGIAELTIADPPRAERAILGLASLYRNVLISSRQPAISMKDELDLVQSYLTVEKLRFGERLSFRFGVHGDVGGALIPPLVIQPLVENAVNHGIALAPRGGVISVDATVGDRRVHVRVTDTGAGWSAGGSGRGAGVGLLAIRRRLQLFFGNEAELTVSHTSGVTVDMFFPVRTPAETSARTGA